MKTWSDQDIAKEIVKKENELYVLQECQKLLKTSRRDFSENHIVVLNNSLDYYETVLVNDIQSLKDLVKESLYINKSYI